MDRAFWTLLTASAVYAANQLKVVSASIEELNVKMGVVVEKISNTDRRVDTLDQRIERIDNLIRR